MRKGKKKEECAFAWLEGGNGGEGCKGELQSTFTRRIINPECGRNMMKKVKQSDEIPANPARLRPDAPADVADKAPLITRAGR